MKKSVVKSQINEMAQALRGGEQEVVKHFHNHEAMVDRGMGWVDTNMRFEYSRTRVLSQKLNEDNMVISEAISLNGMEDPRILIPDEGDAVISYQDEDCPDIRWVNEELDPGQQRILNEYAHTIRKVIQEIIEHEDDDDDEITPEEDERILAEVGGYEQKEEKFQELFRRTFLMGQAVLGEMNLVEELLPEDQEVRETRADWETAFHCLLAAAMITGTEWEPLVDQEEK